MKLLLITILLTSCAYLDPEKRKDRTQQTHYSKQLERCMEKFAKLGYDSDSLVKICGKIYERRK